jgi:hypothetical protein
MAYISGFVNGAFSDRNNLTLRRFLKIRAHFLRLKPQKTGHSGTSVPARINPKAPPGTNPQIRSADSCGTGVLNFG